jgi:hypothetical protein
MTADRLSQFPKSEFIALWNHAGTIDDVVNAVRNRVGQVPRWAVMAWAVALRKKGSDLKRFVADHIES